ncbi:MAG TPA: hypothetical protein VFO38_01590 [Candidatus Saccharimonadales bacterium]|nr:hypothetical protein [Candidatus Saccharimonadales bacterium]
MRIKEVAAAYATLQHDLQAACAAFVETVVKHVPQTDQQVLAENGEQLVSWQKDLMALTLLPVMHKGLTGKLLWLLELHFRSMDATTKAELKLTLHREKQRRAAIDAAKQLVLRGEPFRGNDIGHLAGVDTPSFAHFTTRGFNEILGVALQELVAEALMHFGIPTGQHQG